MLRLKDDDWKMVILKKFKEVKILKIPNLHKIIKVRCARVVTLSV